MWIIEIDDRWIDGCCVQPHTDTYNYVFNNIEPTYEQDIYFYFKGFLS